MNPRWPATVPATKSALLLAPSLTSVTHALACNPHLLAMPCSRVQGFRRPTGRKRLKSKADEARKATDAAGIQKELFGYEGAWRCRCVGKG